MKNKKLLALLMAALATVAVSATAVTGCSGGSNEEPDTHTEHTYGDWEVTITPTDTATGVAERSCTEDDDTQTVTLPVLTDNRYVITGDTATETEAGTGTYTITIDGVQFSFTAATPAKGTTETDVAVTGITLDQTAAEIAVDGTVTLTATVSPEDATDKTVSWVSDNTSVATVENGVVKGVAAGTATITATAGEYTATCTITVTSAGDTHTEHTYGDWSVTTIPTDTATGVAERSCTEGDVTQKVILPVLGDSGYTITDNTATETEAGTGTYSITIDGVTFTFMAATAATGSGDTHTEHTYGDWSVTTIPTDTATGVAERSCTEGDDTQSVTLPVLGDSGYTITDNTATETEAGTGTYTITIDGVTFTFTAATPATGGGGTEEDVTYISTVAEFLAFRATSSDSGLTGTYKLSADIDLTGYTLDDTVVILGEGGVFDGQGYTISNATVSTTSSKIGILFKTIKGGTVTNVKFLNCSITGTSESVAILAGECNGSATISKIEFNACSATTSANYVGMIFARREGSTEITITMSEITTKNGCTTSCAQYGGFLVGDITSGTNLVFKDLDVEGELNNPSGNGSFIAGRTRGGTVSVENAVISATIYSANSNGIFSGNGSLSSLTIKNVLIVESNISNLYQSSKAPSTISIENLVTVSGVTVDSSTASDGEDTATYLKSLGFDFTDVWTVEGESDGYRLIAASTNVKSADATIVSLTLNTGNADTRIKEGDGLSTDGLLVTGVYSDGVQLILTENVDYTVDKTAVDTNTANTYTVTVKSIEDENVIATYTVTVVKETGYAVYDEFVTKVYVAGSETKFDSANLVVKSVWSDGEEETLTTSEYSVDATSYDMTTAGTYNVKITYGSYDAQTIAITVAASAASVTANTVDVYVVKDQSSTVDVSDEGVYTFNTVKDAIDYLEACGYGDEVEKIVHIGAGVYEAKITTSLNHLTLIGENTYKDTDVSVLTYSAVESTVNIVSGSAYGLDCATLQVNGSNLTIKNLTIRNDFDYINDAASESSPQGVALTIAGDKAVIENSHLYGNQDTLYLKNGRAYFTNTLIEGNVDFIFGNATGIAYFYQCEIKSISRYAEGSEGSNNGYVTAMKAGADGANDKPDYGYIFDSCSFTDDGKILDGSMSLGRPWGASATVAMINCSFTKAYSTAAYDGSTKSRWYDMSGNSPVNADFAEYGSTGDGAITEAVNGGRILTDEEAANYTLANIFAATNGECTWTDSWNGSNERYNVTVYNGSTEVTIISVATDVTLTTSTIETAVNAKLDSLYVLDGIYTDVDCTVEYVDGLVTAATSLYITIKPADLTITSSVTYSVSDFSEVTTGTGYIGKLVVDCGESGSFVKHNDSYYKITGDASIKLTLNAGSSVTISMYGQTLAINGTAVGTDAYTDLSGGNYSYTYTATTDGEEVVISMTEGSSQLYISSIAVDVPIVYTETTTINLIDDTVTTIQNGGTMTYEGIYIDTGTSGKYGYNNSSWMQVNAGTTFTLNVAEGATVTANFYDENTDSTTYYTINVSGTTATISVLANTYISSITVTIPEAATTKVEYTLNMDNVVSSGVTLAAGTYYFTTSGYSTTDSDESIISYYTKATSDKFASKSVTYDEVSYKYYLQMNGATSDSNGRIITIDLSAYAGKTVSITVVATATKTDSQLLLNTDQSTSTSTALASTTVSSTVDETAVRALTYSGTVSSTGLYYLTAVQTMRIYAIIITIE